MVLCIQWEYNNGSQHENHDEHVERDLLGLALLASCEAVVRVRDMHLWIKDVEARREE